MEQRQTRTDVVARWSVLALGVLVVLAGALVVLRPSRPASAVSVAARPAAVAPDTEVRIPSGPLQRDLLVQAPTRPGPAKGVVVVLGPHAFTARFTASRLHLEGLRAEGFALAYPESYRGDWNVGPCCGTAHRRGVDDLAFLHQVRALLRTEHPGAAIGLLGYSTGGQMAYRLACEDPGFAMTAVIVSGSLETPCAPSSTLPSTLILHGLGDATVPWAFTLRRTDLLDFAPRPALSSIAAYAAAGGCAPRSMSPGGGRYRLDYARCGRSAGLVAIGEPHAGHGWEGLQAAAASAAWFAAHLGSSPG